MTDLKKMKDLVLVERLCEVTEALSERIIQPVIDTHYRKAEIIEACALKEEDIERLSSVKEKYKKEILMRLEKKEINK